MTQTTQCLDANALIDRDLRHKWIFTAATCAVLVFWFAFIPVGKTIVSTISNVPLLLVPVWWSLLPGRRYRQLARGQDDQPRARRWSCVLVAVSTLTYFAAGCFDYYYALRGEDSFPSIADFFYFAVYLSMLPGVLLVATRGTSTLARGRLLLDSAIIVAALGTFSWYFLLGPILFQSGDSLLATVLSAAYPVFDLAILFCVLLVSGRVAGSRARRVIFPLALGCGLNIVTDTWWGYRALKGVYELGEIVDVGWPAAYLLIGLAMRAHLLAPFRTETAEPAQPAAHSGLALWRSVLPYLFIPLLVALLAYQRYHDTELFYQSGVYAGSGVVLVLLLMRQLLSINENIALNRELNKTLAVRDDLHRQLVAASRQAGMAEVATGVLHNVGNVLNSVNVSASLVSERLKHSEVASLKRAAELIAAHKDDIGTYITADKRGKQLPDFLVALSKALADEQALLLGETTNLAQGLEHIKIIIQSQQAHARNGIILQEVNPASLVETALKMHVGSFAHHDIKVTCDLAQTSTVMLDQHKVLQILVNLVSNAKQAVKASGRVDKSLQLTVKPTEERIRFEVTDNGIGIEPHLLSKIFAHGFTTKREGHGFGLHSAATLAQEMGGSLVAHSQGKGAGATFILELPAKRRQATTQTAHASEH